MSHRHADLPEGMTHRDVPTKPVAVVLLLASLAVVAAGVVAGLVALWPSGDPLPQDASTAYAAPGVSFEQGVVEEVGEPCATTEESVAQECGELVVTLRTGPDADTRQTIRGLPPQVSASGVRVGDTVELQRLPTPAGDPPQYAFNNVDRGGTLGLMAALFVLLVVAVARLRGFLALVGLGFGAFVLVRFVIPALLEGTDGLLVGVVGSAAIMYVVLYLAHGPSVRTSAALAGTLLGVGVTGVVGYLAVDRARLTGVSDDAGAALSSFTEIDFQGLLMCAVIVAGLGVLNDVTITQASAVWELRGAAPGLTRRQLYTSGMRIGRDHIASTIYTIVFAYSGAALSVLLLLYFFDRPLLTVLSSEEIATEVVRTLASGIGLVLAVPLTTAIAALTVSGPRSVDAP